MSELLERAAAELISHPPREAPGVHELRRRLNRRRGRRGAVLGITVAAVMIVGLVAVSGRSEGNSVGNPLEDFGFDNDGTVPCGDYGCGQFDPIGVAPGADDFYVGPASLGDPLISAQFWNGTIRCAELDAAGSTCTRVEGLGGSALVTYGDGNDQIRVGTTFSPNISIEEYAGGRTISQASPTPHVSATTVRGHPAVSFSEAQEKPTTPTAGLMWEERAGVIAWVTVPASRQAELPAIAEGLQTYVGPPSIPGRLVVPNTGVPWGVGVSGNNGSGLLIARFQGKECVAWGYIDTCGGGIEDRTFVHRLGSATAVAGSVPPEVTRVRVLPEFGEPVETAPFSYAGFTSRFYQATLQQDYAASVEWLTADGTVVSTYEVDNDSAAGFGGWPVFRARVDGKAVQLTADIDTTGTTPDPAIGAGKFTGTADRADSLLCTYITMFGPYAVTCSSPEQFNLWDNFNGIVFGAAGSDVGSVVVDGKSVELHSSPDITDRRFFVIVGSKAVFLDRNGDEIAVPAPIDGSQNP